MTDSNSPVKHQANRRPVAYKNEAFLDSPDARELRILSEYLQPLAHFRDEKIHDTIVFFGSARLDETGPLGRFYNEARELARLVTQWSDSLPHESRRFVVCTGGGPGIMEAANRGANDAGGKSIGLNIGLPLEQCRRDRGVRVEWHGEYDDVTRPGDVFERARGSRGAQFGDQFD